MSINEYKEALKEMIDSTNDEALLKHWKTHLEWEFEQYRQRTSEAQQTSSTDEATNKGKDDDEGYVVLESGLGIDE